MEKFIARSRLRDLIDHINDAHEYSYSSGVWLCPLTNERYEFRAGFELMHFHMRYTVWISKEVSSAHDSREWLRTKGVELLQSSLNSKMYQRLDCPEDVAANVFGEHSHKLVYRTMTIIERSNDTRVSALGIHLFPENIVSFRPFFCETVNRIIRERNLKPQYVTALEKNRASCLISIDSVPYGPYSIENMNLALGTNQNVDSDSPSPFIRIGMLKDTGYDHWHKY